MHSEMELWGWIGFVGIASYAIGRLWERMR